MKSVAAAGWLSLKTKSENVETASLVLSNYNKVRLPAPPINTLYLLFSSK